MKYEIISLIDQPQMLGEMSLWFHEKWGIPLEAYVESMTCTLEHASPVPSWYVAIVGNHIIGGLGVIENDFHNRPDLSPNVCAVYVEEAYRGHGIAGALLNHAVEDMKSKGVTPLYLVTDHIGFYERYGWEYFTSVMCEGEDNPSRMYIHR